MLVERLKEKFNVNEPIFTNEILEMFSDFSRAYIFRLIDKAEKNGEIVKFDMGIYFIPTRSIVGISTITVDDVVKKKYIGYEDEFYGLYSGLNLQNIFSATTQMPNTIEVITNNEATRCRKIIIDGRTIILRKSRCKIDSKNIYAYTILQLFSELKNTTNINDRVKESIIKYMIKNKVKATDLFAIAKYFPAQTVKKLMYSGVL